MEEDKLRKEKKMDEHYERMSERVNKKHNLDMAREKSLLTKEMANIGEEIIRAFRKLADMGPEELLTEVSRKEYLVQKEQLEYYTDVHNAIASIKIPNSPPVDVGESSASPNKGRKCSRDADLENISF
ncbi:uncharacterized protein LOC127256757 isoform X2 [Andrographis paniculata]|uniref:uncharacterized protein LOC127256757 isoform X2 n=1 Tax=Andrographis paniculata TaxID=175694 RepID=UPI0021E8E6A8|nr:uncharacterized protein LOC127256757 isoform X2 [Andrographis paniculata]